MVAMEPEAVEPAGPLAGLRVVDLSTRSVAGVQASQMLADFGAEVVWVEPPGGSPLRAHPAFPVWGRGKKSIVLDLHAAEDRSRARELALAGDVVLDSFRPGVVERLGLGHDDLARDNPRIVSTSITGFGRHGPYRDLPGYDAVVMAKTGLLDSFGGAVARPGPAFPSVMGPSFCAAQHAVRGTLAALYERERTGRGRQVDANLVHGIAVYDTWTFVTNFLSKRDPEAFQLVPTVTSDGLPNTGHALRLLVALSADGRWMQFSQVTPRLFESFVHHLGLEEMVAQPRYAGAPEFDVPEPRIELWEAMLKAARSRTVAEWQDLFDVDTNLWAELFRKGNELLDHPQMLHDGHTVEWLDPEVGRTRQPGPIVVMSGTPGRVDRPAPRLDQHRDDVARWARSTEDDPSAPAPGSGPAEAPLEGVTVLELGSFYAGPFSATMLADLGARVIKVEPLTGDPIRQLIKFPDVAAIKVLQGKESIALDLATPEGLAVVHELARRADAVLLTFRAGVAKRLGIDADTLRALNPDLLYLTSPGYGSDGPCGNRPAFAPTIAAGSGNSWRLIGQSMPDGPDLTLEEIKRNSTRVTASHVGGHPDGYAALAAANAMLLGLIGRQRGAGGQSLSTSMLQSMAHALSDDMFDYDGRAATPVPDAQLHGLNALYRLYETADGWVFLAAPSEREWAALAGALHPVVQLGDDTRFASEGGRRRHDAELVEVLSAAFATRPAAAWEQTLVPAGVACVEVASGPFEEHMQDAVGRESNWVTETEHPTLGIHPRYTPLVSLRDAELPTGPACLLGQHTRIILRELGYDDEAIAGLEAAGRVMDADHGKVAEKTTG